MTKNRVRINSLLVLLFFFSLLSVLWVLSQKNSFVYDDVALLSEAHFSSYQSLFHFLPSASYNDRPIRMLFNKMLNDMFGLNYMMYHLVFVIIHLCNVALVYKIGVRIFGQDQKTGTYSAILSAAVFGIYPTSLMAVSWISATCDLLSCLFVLLCIWFYLRANDGGAYSAFYSLLCLLFYYLSLRSKEMSLTLPLILVFYEIGMAMKEKRRVRISWYLLVSVLFMLFYTVLLFKGGRDKVLPDNPYYQNFHPGVLLRNAIRYLFLYFDWGNSGFLFRGYFPAAFPGVAVFCVGVIYSIYLLFKHRDFSLLFSILAIGIALAVVLPMVNMQHRLYLYSPSVFVGFACGFFLQRAFEKRKHNFSWECMLLLIPSLYLIAYTPGMINYRAGWLATCEKDWSSIEQIEKMDVPAKDSTVYIKGASEGYNIFYYGPGDSLRLFYDDATLKTSLVNDFPMNPQKPYVFWKYNNKEIKEIKRDNSTFKLNIISMYPPQLKRQELKLNSDGSMNLGIVCNEINPNLVVYLNGQPRQTTIGKDFISITVPKKDLTKSSITVYVEDTKERTKTKEVTLPITS